MALKNSINRILIKFGVELHGLSYLRALAKGEFKSDEMDILKKVFNTESIIIYDVGANRGLMTRRFIDFFPNASVHAFEPYLPFFETLFKEYEENKNVIVNCQGIADEEGERIFNINKSLDTSSLLQSQITGLNCDEQVQTISQVKVCINTIDKYASTYGNHRINFLKLDIQGSELNALKGASNLLREKKIDFIFCETYFLQQYKDQPSFFDISNYLLQFGYILQDIYHPIYGNGKLAWCDSMYIRDDLIIE